MAAPNQISLDDLVEGDNGGELKDCPNCKGSGERVLPKTGELVRCSNCEGTGRAVIPF